MASTVLITGGAGFIGSFLCDELLSSGYRVRVLDSLHPQVHGRTRARPAHLSPEVDLHVGDVRDPAAVRRALAGIDAVYHLAAAVGVGQSMYEIAEYTSINNLGTAVLIEELSKRQIERLIVASSMSIYGEGLYRDRDGRQVASVERPRERLEKAQWEVVGADGSTLSPLPTPETKAPALASVYALSKYDQERLCLIVGRAYGIPTVALRFFNVYGPRQALSNPYTGVLAIFAARYLNDRPPLVFEDGLQRRDFVSVHDVVRACRQALEVPGASGEALNIGSGASISVREIAERMARALGKRLAPEITGNYRVGDIRHCFADITRAKDVLGYQPRVSLEEGIAELAAWLEGQVAHDHVEGARAELMARGLAI